MVWYEVVWCVLIRMCGWSRERGSRESRRIEGSVNSINYSFSSKYLSNNSARTAYCTYPLDKNTH